MYTYLICDKGHIKLIEYHTWIWNIMTAIRDTQAAEKINAYGRLSSFPFVFCKA